MGLFQEFAASQKIADGEVTMICPKCDKVVGRYLTDVSPFNEWAYKPASSTDVVAFEKIYPKNYVRYHRVEFDGRACPSNCFK